VGERGWESLGDAMYVSEVGRWIRRSRGQAKGWMPPGGDACGDGRPRLGLQRESGGG